MSAQLLLALPIKAVSYSELAWLECESAAD